MSFTIIVATDVNGGIGYLKMKHFLFHGKIQ